MTKIDQLRVHHYLEHILEAMARIYEYTEDMDELTFLKAKQTQDAVIRNIEIIGEACRNIERNYPDFSKMHPDLPLKYAYEMRNVLSHGYFKVDLEVVWRTIENDLPLLDEQIRDIYESIRS